MCCKAWLEKKSEQRNHISLHTTFNHYWRLFKQNTEQKLKWLTKNWRRTVPQTRQNFIKLWMCGLKMHQNLLQMIHWKFWPTHYTRIINIKVSGFNMASAQQKFQIHIPLKISLKNWTYTYIIDDQRQLKTELNAVVIDARFNLLKMHDHQWWQFQMTRTEKLAYRYLLNTSNV